MNIPDRYRAPACAVIRGLAADLNTLYAVRDSYNRSDDPAHFTDELHILNRQLMQGAIGLYEADVTAHTMGHAVLDACMAIEDGREWQAAREQRGALQP